MTAPDVNADVRARFAVTDEDVEASGAAYFDGQWHMLPPRSKAIYRDAIRRALTVYAKRQAAHADLAGEVRELVEAAEEVCRISDRKHDAWDRLKAALAKFRPTHQEKP